MGKPDKLTSSRARPAASPLPRAAMPLAPDVRPWLPDWLKLGAALLFVTGAAFGVLEVHYSTDTWIGLAAGRQILTEPQFPKTDTFSYTFTGTTWYNQNWLSHVYFWLLYDKLGPDAVVYGTWAVGYLTFFLVLLAARLRCGSWLAATLAAALVAIASRDWLSARPATVQFLFVSALWLALSALAGQTERRRWWPVALLAGVFLLWPHAHGSFVLGYGLTGLLVACFLLARVLRRKIALSDAQILAVIAVVVVTAILGAVLSPYGIENYLHPTKVAKSDIFRQVGEWHPPYREGMFPPVTRFWIAFAVAFATPLAALMLRFLDPLVSGRAAPPSATGRAEHARSSPRSGSAAAPSRADWPRLIFDLTAVAIGLGMAMWARRFAPMFYILSTPALAALTMHLARGLSPLIRVHVRDGIVASTWLIAGFSVYVVVRNAYNELVLDVAKDARRAREVDVHNSLLDRVTRFDSSPRDALDFLARNHLKPKIVTDWKLAGPVMFFVPGAQVYIDGRAQQVYDEEHYMSYLYITNGAGGPTMSLTDRLVKSGTDTMLLPMWSAMDRLVAAIQSDPQWVLVLQSHRGSIWFRQGTPIFDEVLRRERAGDLWWPEKPVAQAGRASFLMGFLPEQMDRAVALWQAAVAREIELGLHVYAAIAVGLRDLNRAPEAAAYLSDERNRIARLSDLAPELRSGLLESIRRAENALASPPSRTPTRPSGG